MAESTPNLGDVAWIDLTVPNATEVRDFYTSVTGWESSDVSMGEYDDYCVGGDAANPVAGICHARGTNANIPVAWMIYILVENVEASAAKCRELGGEVIDGPRKLGNQMFCIIKDPAGAVSALIEGGS